MTPKSGQIVQLFLRYNIQVEGTVKKWDDEQIILMTENGPVIVYNPREDLIMAKMIAKAVPKPKPFARAPSPPPEDEEEANDFVFDAAPAIDNDDPAPYDNDVEVAPQVADLPEQKKAALEHAFEEAYNMPSLDPAGLRTMKLVKLRSMMREADEEIARHKLKETTLGVPPTYGSQFSTIVRPARRA